nr:cytochrome P450 [Sphingomonas yantingensis]
MSSFEDLGAYLAPIVSARREAPGNDLLSTIVNAEIGGEKIAFDKAISFSMLVMFGGLDTVASMLGFIARFLATHDGVRRQIAARLDDAAFLRHATEELLRRHGVANTARVLTRDVELDGAVLKAGEMILPPNMLVGLDERKVSDPTTVDLSRPFPIHHATFGNGVHTCPGAVLARREIQVFLEEWLRRIPDFRIRAGTRPVMATGMVNGVLKLELEWEAAA